MLHDFFGALSAESLVGVLLEESVEQTAQLDTDEGRVVGVAELDFVEEFCTVLGVEGWKADDHLEYDRSQTPPVDGFAMTLFGQHFRSEVLGSAAD